MERFGEKVNCNPKVSLKKDFQYPLIDIEKIHPGVKFVRAEDLVNYSGQSCSKFEQGDVLMARITPCLENGKIAIAKISSAGFGSTELLVFRGIPNISNTDYIFYLLCMKFMRDLATNSMTGASGRQRADLNFIKKIPWIFPSLKIQQKIASILSAYDNLIENNNKRIKILEQMAENLYKEWFVRFRFPGYENTEFENGLPKGWKNRRLGDFIKFERGVSYSSTDIENGDNVLLSMNNIKPFGGFIEDYTRSYSGKFKEFQVVNKNDLIMSITDMTQDRRIIGYVGLVPYCEKRLIICTHLLKLTSSEYPKLFLYGLFNYSNLSRNIAERATGTNVLGLTSSILEKVKTLLPNEDLISKFVEIVNPIYEQTFLFMRKNKNLIKQRDLLLPRLMSGKLEVKVEADG